MTEIDELIQTKHPDLVKGDKAYPGIYQQTVTEYMDSMSEDEKTEMEQLLAEWQSEGPPWMYASSEPLILCK